MTLLNVVLKNGHTFFLMVEDVDEFYYDLDLGGRHGDIWLEKAEIAAIYPEQIDSRSVTDEPEHRQFIHDPNHDRFGWKARLAKQSDAVDSH